MALYEYHCSHCDYYFEVQKHIREFDEKQYCPKCGHLTERQFPHKMGAVIFKGEGFHKNDYKGKTDGK